jgi:periplasmic copper chaperone A
MKETSMLIVSRTFALAAACAALCAPVAVLAQSAAKVEAAWARPTVQGQAAGGGFLKITGGTAGDRLLGGSAEVSKAVELHTMQMDGDVMRMRQVPVIEVPAGGTVELKPGGLHLMFMGLKQPLKAGESFPLTLRFEKAGEVKVDVKISVQPPAGSAAGHGGHKH